MTLFLHLLPGHVAVRLWDFFLATCRDAPLDAHADAASAVLLWALLAIASSARAAVAAADDFCELQDALVDAAKATASWDRLRRAAPRTVAEVRAAIDRCVGGGGGAGAAEEAAAAEADAADAATPTRRPAERFPNTNRLVAGLRDWFATSEYVHDDVKQKRAPRSSAKRKRKPAPARSPPRGGPDAVELATFRDHTEAASPARARLRFADEPRFSDDGKLVLDRALA